MFTTNQIEELRRKLRLEGVKDTSFPDASAIKGNEILALVQEGVNKKMTTKEFARYVSKFVSVTGEGGSIDPSVFDAAITAYESEIAAASIDYEDGVFNFKLGLPRGAEGPAGPTGAQGPIVYPAGIYDENTVYETTEKTAPYVLDNGKYYVLNAITTWQGIMQPDGYNTPSTNYNDGQNPDAVWEPFEMFEAIYSDIGVFNQALVGSAVFWKGFMFSQQGVNASGNPDTNYENFNPDDPFAEGNSFYPNICFNYLTGECWLGKNKFVIDSNGNIKLGNIVIDNEGLSYRFNDGNIDVTMSFNQDGIILYDNIEQEYIHEINSYGHILFAKTRVAFKLDGSGRIGGTSDENAIISWDKDGNLKLGGFIYKEGALYYDNDDGSRFSITPNGIHYSNSDNNTYFDIDSNGNATFASGQAQFNADGSGYININDNGKATLKWDSEGNITQCNLNDQALVEDAEYYTELRPNTTKYLKYVGVDSGFNLMIPKRTYKGDEIVSGDYYGSIVVLNTLYSTIRVYIAEETTVQPTTYVDLEPYGSVRINYFLSNEDEVFAYIEGKHQLYTN